MDTAPSPLTPVERELVALGAALASNCVPCIEHHVPAARAAGLDDARIRAAILLADKVRQVPAEKVRRTAMDLLGGASPTGPDAAAPSSCGGSAAGPSPERPCCA